MTNTTSIQSRLVKMLIMPLSIFTVIFFIFIYYLLQNKVNTFFDNRLFATAQSIEQSLGIENSKLIVDIPNFSIDFLSSEENGLVYYSVVNDKEELIVGYKNIFSKYILKNKDKLFYDSEYHGSKLRVISYKTSIVSSLKTYYAYITVGETTQERDENINSILSILLIVMFILVSFTITITLVATKKGLKPLHKLKNIVKKRDERDLEPIVFDAPKELEDVVNSINILLERSRNTIDYIEQFNSDVSHQLRTPIAEMKVKLDLLYKKDDEDYLSLNALLKDMSHITEQLLLYAKTNPNAINLKRFKKQSLNQICKEYSLKTAPRIYTKGFEFAFENLNEEIFIQADSILLESMFDNIINNAMHYAVDENNQPLGTITLSLERHNNTIWLNIKDEGRGIKKENLKNIFKRYYRIDASKKGSGLGLSIVKQIAQLHRAKVLATNESGLKISIIFTHKSSSK